jgi:hypothetical protein
MFRTNGGLLGVRRVPTLGSAPGIWSIVEQGLAQQASVWPTNNPIPGLSPILWYDFADETTVTVASSQITQITDKGSRGWTLSKSTTGPGYATGINGKKCVDWGAAGHLNYLRNTSATSTAIGEIYVVLDASFGSTFPGYNGLITDATGETWYAIGRSGTAAFDAVNGTPAHNQAFINASTSNVYTSAVLPSINSASILRLNRSDGNAYTTTKGFQVGNDRSYDRGWSGLIGEIVGFTAQLSSTNRTNVLNWLSGKWGISLIS